MRLHFIPAGRELNDPMTLEEALCFVAIGRRSADTEVFSDTGGLGVQLVPPDGHERIWAAGEVLRKALFDGDICTYVQNPTTGQFLRMDRLYHKHEVLQFEVRALVDAQASGWDDSLIGQPMLVCANDIQAWRNLVAPSAETPQSPQPKPKPIPDAVLRGWFTEERVPAFAEKAPPAWKDCWDAAIARFPEYWVTKDKLQSIRREACPVEWSRPGRRNHSS